MVTVAAAGTLLPVTSAQATEIVQTQNLTTPSQFDIIVPTPDPAQSYYSVYSLTPVGWTHGVGTVYFYMGPTADSVTNALEQALLDAPDSVKADIEQEINTYGPGNITPPNLDTNVQTNGATPMCGHHDRICQRYEEMRYCYGESTTQSENPDGRNPCSLDGWRLVAGVFSYDNNGAYSTDSGDYVDCSQNNSDSDGTGGYFEINPTWCGEWNTAPWSSSANKNTTFMDYGMNANVGDYNNNGGDHYSVWIRMDDYAGCGSVGNRGGSSQ